MNPKVCTGCNQSLPLDAFGNKSGPKANKDGKRPRCKNCELNAYKIYRQNNRDKVRETHRKWASQNKDKKSQHDANYRAKYPEKIKQNRIKWAAQNPDWQRNYYLNRTPEQVQKKKEADINYGRANRQKTVLHSRKYRANNLEKAREASRRWERANPHKVAEKRQRRRAATYKNGVYKVAASELLHLYQGNCFYCQVNLAVSIDHIIPIARGGRHSIGNLVGACKSCNSSKGAKTIMEWRLWKLDKSKNL